jgi:hypothetical protein
VVAERLGIVPDEIGGGRGVMLGRPGEPAGRLRRCWTETAGR